MRLEKRSDGRAELWISDEADEKTLEAAGKRLQAEFGAVPLKRLSGVDQSYWDFQLGEAVVTLHREHYLGVSLFGKDDAGERAVLELARRLGAKEP